MENLVTKSSVYLLKNTLKYIDKYAFTDFYAKINNFYIGFHRNDYEIGANEFSLIHLPKTGGTTIKSILVRNQVKNVLNIDKHMPVSLSCNPEEYSYVTIMRNPIDRVFSYYQMQLRDKKQPYHFHAKDGLATLLRNCWEVNNTACMYYSGFIDANVDNKCYEIAKQNLNNFAFVGNFDNFNTDVSKLLSILNLNIENIPILNFHGIHEATSKEIKLIESYNEFDIKLFNEFFKSF